ALEQLDLSERLHLALELGGRIAWRGPSHTHQAKRQLTFALHLEVSLFLLLWAADHADGRQTSPVQVFDHRQRADRVRLLRFVRNLCRDLAEARIVDASGRLAGGVALHPWLLDRVDAELIDGLAVHERAAARELQ